MVRAAAKNHASVTVVVDPGRLSQPARRPGREPGFDPCGHAAEAGRQGLRPHRAVRRDGVRLFHRRDRRRSAYVSRRSESVVSQAHGLALRRESTSTGGLLPGSARHRRLRDAPRPVRFRARSSRSTTSPTATRRSSACGYSTPPACVIVKHANPCGVALGDDLHRRLRRRLPHRPYLGLRRHHRVQSGTRCRHRQGHSRAPIRRGHPGPHRCQGGRARCWARRTTCACSKPAISGRPLSQLLGLQERRRRTLLVQTRDDGSVEPHELRVVTRSGVRTGRNWRTCCFAWRIAKFVKSNAIVCVKEPLTAWGSAPAR